jgi:hypothetical protein
MTRFPGVDPRIDTVPKGSDKRMIRFSKEERFN